MSHQQTGAQQPGENNNNESGANEKKILEILTQDYKIILVVLKIHLEK